MSCKPVCGYTSEKAEYLIAVALLSKIAHFSAKYLLSHLLTLFLCHHLVTSENVRTEHLTRHSGNVQCVNETQFLNGLLEIVYSLELEL